MGQASSFNPNLSKLKQQGESLPFCLMKYHSITAFMMRQLMGFVLIQKNPFLLTQQVARRPVQEAETVTASSSLVR
jgi:hypothetical protein